jgi:prolyl 4-hydroxylase
LRPVRVQMISESPRVRVLHNFVTEYEAQKLIELAGPHFHRSSTARAGADDKRTSNSATLASGDPVVSAVRHRIAFYCGYPEPNLEPLQVRLHADGL